MSEFRRNEIASANDRSRNLSNLLEKTRPHERIRRRTRDNNEAFVSQGQSSSPETATPLK